MRLSTLLNRRGTAAIEFALAAPILVTVLMATVELGRAMYEAMQVYNAVEAGMMYAAKNGWDFAGITNAVVNASAVFGAPAQGLTASPAPSQFCGCPSAAGIASAACTGSPCTDGAAPRQYVKINAALPHLALMPGSGLPIPDTFTATVVLRIN